VYEYIIYDNVQAMPYKKNGTHDGALLESHLILLNMETT